MTNLLPFFFVRITFPPDCGGIYTWIYVSGSEWEIGRKSIKKQNAAFIIRLCPNNCKIGHFVRPLFPNARKRYKKGLLIR